LFNNERIFSRLPWRKTLVSPIAMLTLSLQATIITPQFKLYWLDVEALKVHLLDTLKIRVRAVTQ